MGHVDWASQRAAFEPDGGLRDIYVLHADLSIWRRVLEWLRASGKVFFTIDGSASELPTEAAELFRMRPAHSPLLTFYVGSVDLACHFFTESQIEFDLVPNDVSGSEPLEAILKFLLELSAVSRSPALLTLENQPDEVLFLADANSRSVTYYRPTDRCSTRRSTGW